ncbi:MAG: hypothetical protein ACRD20_10330 [Terriglobales bacterium]
MARHPYRVAYALLLLLFEGCTQTGVRRDLDRNIASPGIERKVLAVYEPWFGHPSHISVGYSSQDPVIIRKQIDEAKALGISGFVVDWYGDREPFLDRSYALLQSIAAEKQFKIAMMYDETQVENGQATDDTLAAFDKFRQTYLAPDAPGRQAYLTYDGRPMIFIFPKSNQTDWSRVRAETDKWDPRPLLIYEDRHTPFASLFDGFYAWVNPGKEGFAADGSNWGGDYLSDFYQRMRSKYPDKIAVGAAWAGFDDSKASWGLNRHISQRCGQTFSDTLKLSREYSNLPFLLIATWNDYEEGTAIERGLAKCSPQTG